MIVRIGMPVTGISLPNDQIKTLPMRIATPLCLLCIFSFFNNQSLKAQCPTADAGPNKNICLNGSVQIGPADTVANATYTWSPAGYYFFMEHSGCLLIRKFFRAPLCHDHSPSYVFAIRRSGDAQPLYTRDGHGHQQLLCMSQYCLFHQFRGTCYFPEPKRGPCVPGAVDAAG